MPTAKPTARHLVRARDLADSRYTETLTVDDKPTEQPYGIDFGFRDPSGNSFRVAQRTPIG